MRKPFNGDYRINQTFNDACCRQTYVQAFGWIGHNGIDYGLPTSTPVVSAHNGSAYVGWEPGGYGNYVFVTGGGYESVYGHLSRVDVRTGQMVSEGQQIGLSGSTGFSSGPHLHFGVRPIPYNRNNGFGGYIDPQPLLTQTNQGGNMPTLNVSQGIYDAFTNKMKPSDEASYYRSILGREPEAGFPLGTRTYGDFLFQAVPEMIAHTKERLAYIQRINELEAAGGATLATATPKQLAEELVRRL